MVLIKGNAMLKTISISFIFMSLGLSTISNAAPVPITNPGFETDVFADGGFQNGLATGWTITNVAGTFNPNNTTQMPPIGAPEGQNTLFMNSGTASQVLTTNLMADTIYTLEVDVCDRADVTFPPYAIELIAGATVIASDTGNVAPNAPATTCLTSTISYTSTSNEPEIGNALQINFATGGAQVNFDNVRLDASPVPKVPTLSQWMLGLLILALMLTSLKLRRFSV